MPGGEAALAVAGHRVRGHGDDADVARRCRARARGSPRSPRGRPSPASARPSARGRSASRSSASSASRPLLATVDGVAAPRQQPDRDALVDDVVLGQQDARARTPACSARRRPPTSRRTARRRDALRARRRSRRAARPGVIGLVRYAAMPSSRQRAESPYCARRGQHHDRRAGQLGLRRDLLRDREAVHVRHVRVEQHQRERRAASRGRAPAPSSAAAPLSTAVGRHPPARRAARRGCAGSTSLSSTISTGRCGEQRLGTRPRRRVGDVEARR